MRFRREGRTTSSGGTIPVDCGMIPMGRYGKDSEDKIGGGVEVMLNIRHDEV